MQDRTKEHNCQSAQIRTQIRTRVQHWKQNTKKRRNPEAIA